MDSQTIRRRRVSSIFAISLRQVSPKSAAGKHPQCAYAYQNELKVFQTVQLHILAFSPLKTFYSVDMIQRNQESQIRVQFFVMYVTSYRQSTKVNKS